MIVLGHSVGAVLASCWVHDFAPPIRALILGTPAFRVKLYVPFAIPALRLLQNIRGNFFVSSYVKGRLLTHDAEIAEDYNKDPLVSLNIAVNILIDLYDTSTRLIENASSINVPTLMLLSGSDFVVDLKAPRKFFSRLSTAEKEIETFPGFYHALFHEKE